MSELVYHGRSGVADCPKCDNTGWLLDGLNPALDVEPQRCSCQFGVAGQADWDATPTPLWDNTAPEPMTPDQIIQDIYDMFAMDGLLPKKEQENKNE